MYLPEETVKEHPAAVYERRMRALGYADEQIAKGWTESRERQNQANKAWRDKRRKSRR